MSKMELIPPTNVIRKYSTCSQADCEEFYKENFNFFTYGPSQKSLVMIVNIVNAEYIPEYAKKTQLQQIFLQVLNETALNELQIALWSIVADKFVWYDKSKGLRLLLIFAALFTRQKLGECIEFLLQKYSEKEENFNEKYSGWVQCIGKFDVSVKELNMRFKLLSETINWKVNYNFYVDDIILRYLPYTHANKQKIEEDLEEEIKNQERIQEVGIINIQEADDALDLYPLPLDHRTSSKGFSSMTISLYICSSP